MKNRWATANGVGNILPARTATKATGYLASCFAGGKWINCVPGFQGLLNLISIL
jgi:hypothetical protein